MRPIKTKGMGQAQPANPPIQQNSSPLPSGVLGNEKTIKFMVKLARLRGSNPYVRDVARAIILEARTADHDFAAEAKAIGAWVQKNIHYLRDVAGEELVIDPLTLLEQASRGEAAGDCDDMALLSATLLLASGSHPYFRAIRYFDTAGPYDHIYTVVYEADATGAEQRLVLDCIIKDQSIGTEVNQESGKEYPV